MSYKTYKTADIVILTIIAVLAEVLGIGAVALFFEEGSPISFVISLSLPIVLIIMIRWNGYGLIAAILIGIANHLVLKSTDFSHLVIYGLGNLGIAASFILFKTLGKKRIKNDWIMTTLYYLLGYVSVIILRSALASLFGNHFLDTLLHMIIQGELLSLFMGWIVILIARRQQSLMVDMKRYLLTMHMKEVNRDGL